MEKGKEKREKRRREKGKKEMRNVEKGKRIEEREMEKRGGKGMGKGSGLWVADSLINARGGGVG